MKNGRIFWNFWQGHGVLILTGVTGYLCAVVLVRISLSIIIMLVAQQNGMAQVSATIVSLMHL